MAQATRPAPLGKSALPRIRPLLTAAATPIADFPTLHTKYRQHHHREASALLRICNTPGKDPNAWTDNSWPDWLSAPHELWNSLLRMNPDQRRKPEQSA